MSTTSRRITVICPKCGEDNADNFRFCGMCGASLETAMAARSRGVTVPDSGVDVALTIPANPRKTARAGTEKQVEPISGPSLLGLGQPTLDSLRDKAFSGSDPLFEVEEPRTGGRKVLLLLLLAALGAAGWWTYTNYIAIGRQEPPGSNPRATLPPSPTVRSVPSSQPPATGTTNSNTTPTNPPPAAGTPPKETASQASEKPPAKANANSESKASTDETGAGESGVSATPGTPEQKGKATSESREPERTGKGSTATKAEEGASNKENQRATRVSKAAAPLADTGEAEFHKGETLLYGRGVRENCSEAIRYLKASSAKQNARARSTFGTMYATGHCVPRDLPTSYSWFALALRADPNNQILEKDLRAIWNQMTPPERQLATKLKQ